MNKIKTLFNRLFSNKLIRSGLVYVISDFVNKGLPFLTLPLFLYYLPPDEIGKVSNFMVFYNLVTVIVGLGAYNYISVIYYKESNDKIRKYFHATLYTVIYSSLIILLLIIIFHSQIVKFVGLNIYYIILGLLIAQFQVIINAQLMILRLKEKANIFGMIQIFQTVLNLGIGLLLIVSLQMKAEGRVIGIIIANIIIGFWSFFLLYKEKLIGINCSIVLQKSLIAFGLPLIPHGLSIWGKTSIDRIIITTKLGYFENGIFSTATNFGLVISFVTVAFNNAFSPFIYKKLSERDDVQLKANKLLLVKYTWLYLLFLVVFCLISYFGLYIITKYYLPASYLSTISFYPWIIGTQLFHGIYLLFVNYIFFARKTAHLATITFSIVLFQGILTYFLVHLQGIIGGAYSMFISSVVNAVLIYLYSNKVYKMPFFSYLKSSNVKRENT